MKPLIHQSRSILYYKILRSFCTFHFLCYCLYFLEHLPFYGSSWCKECSSRTAWLLPKPKKRRALCSVLLVLYITPAQCKTPLYNVNKDDLDFRTRTKTTKIDNEMIWYIFCNWFDRNFFRLLTLFITI